ncbi:MAG: glycosidase [Polaribacter sp.]|nr:glycosidase [Polaribacter sp.]
MITQHHIQSIPNGVMFNAYPDSIGQRLSDTIKMLQLPEFKEVFSLFYILPTFFNSDLDRGFSIIDYNLNPELVSAKDLKALQELHIMLKFDIVLNHLSVASTQFKDLLQNGEHSNFKDFFINWNSFWEGKGTKNQEGIIVPEESYLNKLFMRKSGLPILKVPFPDGSEQPYWNTFYQEIQFQKITIDDLKHLKELDAEKALLICKKVNQLIDNKQDITRLDFNEFDEYKTQISQIIHQKRTFLGQMDVNAKSELVWEFYEETLAKVANYGCKILRLDAFAYLHKEIGQSNFFNKPGTWNYLERIKDIATKNKLIVLPEIHAEYGLNLHDEVAKEGYQIYDFFLPGLMIHTLEKGSNIALLKWATEIKEKGYQTVNMLGCHDGIPVLDLKGKELNGIYHKGLLTDEEIEFVMETILERGGKVKNLYDATGNKISYYQINATFFSALGENENKLVLARALQLFMPGIPQVWYLDLFAGKNNNEAANKGGSSSHKEINRTSLNVSEIENGLKRKVVANQLQLMRLRNTSKAFLGKMTIHDSLEKEISISWTNENCIAKLEANLIDFSFKVSHSENDISTELIF